MALPLLASCRSASLELVVISADRRIAEVAGVCEVRYEPDGPILTVQPEAGTRLNLVTETFLIERAQLERALRLRIERLEQESNGVARPSRWRPE